MSAETQCGRELVSTQRGADVTEKLQRTQHRMELIESAQRTMESTENAESTSVVDMLMEWITSTGCGSAI